MCVVGVAVTGCCGLPDGSDRTLMLKVMVQAQQLLARKEALVRHLKSMNLEAARMVRRCVACVHVCTAGAARTHLLLLLFVDVADTGWCNGTGWQVL